jgi:transcriptional regulator with XRE-family HTH domain
MSNVLCNFFLLFSKFFRKLNMDAKGWTLEELASKLGIPENTVQQRLHRSKIDPFFRGSIYPPDTLDRIREAPMGRPKKAKPDK